eukprot:1157419-Pelagomonas_calceolata.AAC.2
MMSFAFTLCADRTAAEARASICGQAQTQAKQTSTGEISCSCDRCISCALSIGDEHCCRASS